MTLGGADRGCRTANVLCQFLPAFLKKGGGGTQTLKPLPLRAFAPLLFQILPSCFSFCFASSRQTWVANNHLE